MKKELTYSENVFEFLDKMDVGTIELTKLCKPETKAEFIKTVKLYIDKGIINGYCTEFDSGMTKITKFDTILRTSIQIFKESL